MRVLGIDTATPASAAAVSGADNEVYGAWEDAGPQGRPRHSELILELCTRVLSQAQLGWRELDLVAVGVGPGAYTGLRIGIASARGIARSAGVRLTGIGTLEALAAAAPGGDALAVLDARRGEAFAGAWRGGSETCAEMVLAPERLGSLIEPGQLSVGPGAIRWRGYLEEAGARVPRDESPLHRVDARVICRLAATGPGSAPQPRYLRRSDAEIALEARKRKT